MREVVNKNLLYNRRVIKALYLNSSLSCAELSATIKKSLPITTKFLNNLLQEGLVVENGHAPSTGGRRPATFSLRSNFQYVVSVAMDQFVTRIAIMDMQNTVVFGEEKFELSLPNNPGALPELTKLIGQVIENSGIPKNKIAGVGIGMPGFIDVRKGLNYSYLPVSGTNITDYIASGVNLPVFIDNDSSLIALAELRFGSAKSRTNAMVVNIGWGIGLGMVINGELFHGADGFAGEFSHIPLFLNGKLCACGKHGCLETEASLLEIVSKAEYGLKAGKISKLKTISVAHCEQSLEAIIGAAHDGDQFAIELLTDAGYTIGRGVAILIHLLNPELIILSGRGSLAGRLWLAPIQQALNKYCIPRLSHGTIIELSKLGYDAELIGAAALVMENYEKALIAKHNAASPVSELS